MLGWLFTDDTAIWLLKLAAPVVRDKAMVFFRPDPNKPTCVIKASWETYPEAGRFMKVEINLTAKGDSDLEIVGFDVATPRALSIIESTEALACHIYERAPLPAATTTLRVSVPIEGRMKNGHPNQPADGTAPWHKSISLYIGTSNGAENVASDGLFNDRLLMLKMLYRHADEGTRIRKAFISVNVPVYKQAA